MLTTTRFTPTAPLRRRPRTASAPGVLSALDGQEQVARQLAADLAALVRAGLVALAGADDDLRLAVVEPDRRSGVSTKTPHRARYRRADQAARSVEACKTDERGVG